MLVHVGVPEIEVQRCSVPTVSGGLGTQQKNEIEIPNNYAGAMVPGAGGHPLLDSVQWFGIAKLLRAR